MDSSVDEGLTMMHNKSKSKFKLGVWRMQWYIPSCSRRTRSRQHRRQCLTQAPSCFQERADVCRWRTTDVGRIHVNVSIRLYCHSYS